MQVVLGPGKAHRAAKAMSELLGEAPVQDAAEIAAQNKRQLKAKTNLRRATISRQIRHHLHAADPRFYCRRSAAGDSDVNCHGDAVPADAQGTLPDALNFMKVFSKGLFTFRVIPGGL